MINRWLKNIIMNGICSCFGLLVLWDKEHSNRYNVLIILATLYLHTRIQLQIFRQLLLSWPSWRRSTQKGPTVYLFGTIYAWGKLYLSTAVCLAANPEAHQKDTVSGQEQGTVNWYACGKEAAGRVEGRLVSKHSGWGERGETLGV